jgi:hypothetical protein
MTDPKITHPYFVFAIGSTAALRGSKVAVEVVE